MTEQQKHLDLAKLRNIGLIIGGMNLFVALILLLNGHTEWLHHSSGSINWLIFGAVLCTSIPGVFNLMSGMMGLTNIKLLHFNKIIQLIVSIIVLAGAVMIFLCPLGAGAAKADMHIGVSEITPGVFTTISGILGIVFMILDKPEHPVAE